MMLGHDQLVDVTDALHPFERAGLGKAPFRLTRTSENVYVACQGAPAQPGGTCDFCHTGIRYQYHVRGVEGPEFVVGCECVRRLGGHDNRLISDVERAERLRKRELSRQKRAAAITKELARIENAFTQLSQPETRDALAKETHPTIAGKTLLDYVEWMRQNARHSGRLRAARTIEKISV